MRTQQTNSVIGAAIAKIAPGREALVKAMGEDGLAKAFAALRAIAPELSDANCLSRVQIVAAGSDCECDKCAAVRGVFAEVAPDYREKVLVDLEAAMPAAIREVLREQAETDPGAASSALMALLDIPEDDDSSEDAADDEPIEIDGVFVTRHKFQLSVVVSPEIKLESWEMGAVLGKAVLETFHPRTVVAIARVALLFEPELRRSLADLPDAAPGDVGFPRAAIFDLQIADGLATRFVLDVGTLADQESALAAARAELMAWLGSDDLLTVPTGLFAEAGIDRNPFLDDAPHTPEQVARHVRAWLLYGPSEHELPRETIAKAAALGREERAACAALAIKHGWADADRIAVIDADYDRHA